MSLDYKKRVSDNYKNDPNIVEKRKKTNILKYGTEHGCQNVIVKNKLRDSLKDEFGLIGFQQIGRQEKANETLKNFKDRVNDNKKKTYNERYGKDHYIQTEKFLTDREKMWMEKYGTSNIFDVNNPKTKYYNGIIYQSSYDLYFIKKIEELGLIEFLSRGNTVHYTFEGKNHKYYIDFKLNDYQIEIKSSFTYNKNKQINDIKFNKAKEIYGNSFLVLTDIEEIDKFLSII